MAKQRLRFSRWRRLTGAYRFGDRKPPDPNLEPQRISLYLPGGLLDRAEALALRSGAESLQDYCERLLRQAIEGELAREQVEEIEAKRGPLEGLDAISNDPEYLAEWSESAHTREHPHGPEIHFPDAPTIDVTRVEAHPMDPAPEERTGLSPAAEIVLRQAALTGDDPTGFLATLRRGEGVNHDSARELLQALIDLEVEYRDARLIDRRLSYALHRLAFEGQLLLTDAYPGAAGDAATVDVLRLVQEGVDRVLSGEDIRYFPQST